MHFITIVTKKEKESQKTNKKIYTTFRTFSQHNPFNTPPKCVSRNQYQLSCGY